MCNKHFEKRGLHNWKNLFRKPTLQDWTILVMLMLVLGMAYAYKHDVSQCRTFLEDLEAIACSVCGQQIDAESKQADTFQGGLQEFNFSKIEIKT